MGLFTAILAKGAGKLSDAVAKFNANRPMRQAKRADKKASRRERKFDRRADRAARKADKRDGGVYTQTGQGGRSPSAGSVAFSSFVQWMQENWYIPAGIFVLIIALVIWAPSKKKR